MSEATPHRATLFHWSEMDRTNFNSAPSCILELRARVEALEAGATCPHIVSSDEGTSYCGLAEQQAAPPPEPAPAGSLVETVADAIYRNGTGDGFRDEARAAIRAVAAALNEWQDSDSEQLLRTTWEAVRWLEQEAER